MASGASSIGDVSGPHLIHNEEVIDALFTQERSHGDALQASTNDRDVNKAFSDCHCNLAGLLRAT
eukprot:scaffold10376_cov131-Isochrysis_galbana.AAC.7